jgi:hypothetical protein
MLKKAGSFSNKDLENLLSYNAWLRESSLRSS